MIYGPSAIVQADGLSHAVASSRTPCQWVQIQAKSGNAGNIWLGGSDIAVGKGIPLAAGAQFFPPIGDSTYIDLNQLYYLFDDSGTSDTFYIIYGRK